MHYNRIRCKSQPFLQFLIIFGSFFVQKVQRFWLNCLYFIGFASLHLQLFHIYSALQSQIGSLFLFGLLFFLFAPVNDILTVFP